MTDVTLWHSTQYKEVLSKRALLLRQPIWQTFQEGPALWKWPLPAGAQQQLPAEPQD